MNRCKWADSDPLYHRYHDKEWGVPVHSDRKLFEFIILEGAQAGLSWLTVLKKRAAYREAFDKFDFTKVAKYNENKVKKLLNNAGIIRNQLKIRSAIKNARAFMEIRKEFGTFNKYIWQFVDNKPIQNRWKSMQELPATSALSDEISLDLKKRGFNFVGSTIVYANMQTTGMVNDHTTDCFRYKEIRALGK